MKAMRLEKTGPVTESDMPLVPCEMPDPIPGDGDQLISVTACGVCHTELDEIEGRLPPPQLPVIPGHQVIGRVTAAGPGANRFRIGDRVGVAWIFSACGHCEFCRAGRENLCKDFKGTGKDAHGGYAEQMVVPEAFAHAIPDRFTDAQAAPLLCAGAIGYRSLALTGIADGRPMGLTGFGASAHLVLKMAAHQFPNSPVYVFARNPAEQAFARELGAAWAGGTEEAPPQPMTAVIDTTPAWKPVISALAHLAPGGRLVINAIRKEAGDNHLMADIDYPRHLWMEKEIKSVANVTRRDVAEFLDLAAAIPILPEVDTYPLAEANQALIDLKHRRVRGAKVLVVSE